MFSNYRKSWIAVVAVLVVAASCTCTEDPGPMQKDNRDFAAMDFDRIEMGSGFTVDVEQSSDFKVEARGDRRNLDDLQVFVDGSTLKARFRNDANRHHSTHIEIKMPALAGIDFSGGTYSKVEGFESDQQLDVYLSGSALSELKVGYRKMKLVLSGASKLDVEGLGDELNAEVTGASQLTAFEYPVRTATVEVSGASHGKVTVSDDLKVKAAGASWLLYRGSPSVTADVSGASGVRED
jgi:hypothetical protein